MKNTNISDRSTSNIIIHEHFYFKEPKPTTYSTPSIDSQDIVDMVDKRPPPKTVGAITEYVYMELSPYEFISSADVATTYVIDTEFLRDSFNLVLTQIRLDTIIGKDDIDYSTCTDHIFCAIVEISLCMISNSGNDIEDAVESVLQEQCINGVSIREIVSTPNDIDGSVVMNQLVTPIYLGLAKYLLSLSDKTEPSDLIPISWSYPDYKYLAIGEFYD